MLKFSVLKLLLALLTFHLIFFTCCEAASPCNLEFKAIDGELNAFIFIKIPKNRIKTKNVIKMYLDFVKTIKNDFKLPEIMLDNPTSVKQKIESNKPVKFYFTLNSFDNIPSVRKIVVNKLIICKRINVISYKLHEDFDDYTEYDIAIIDTEEITDHNFVPICLTTDTDISLLGQTGQVASYASNAKDSDETEEVNFVLKGAKFKVISNSECNDDENVPDHSLCVGSGDGGAYFCRGDSGAGFMVQNDQRYFLMGVVSSVQTVDEGECEEESNVVFTDVGKFLAFITKRSKIG
uniref:CSON009025 protein n=1 Tax=Culicoides sonorensis TaxID=179676 RepID=A0A336LKS5_CULSO